MANFIVEQKLEASQELAILNEYFERRLNVVTADKDGVETIVGKVCHLTPGKKYQITFNYYSGIRSLKQHQLDGFFFQEQNGRWRLIKTLPKRKERK